MSNEHHLDQRSRYLEAVAEAMSLLLKPGDFKIEMEEALGILGDASRASRICVYENIVGPDGSDLLVSERFSWRRPGTLLFPDIPSMENVPYRPHFSRWLEELSRGQLIVGLVRTFPDSERDLLAALHAKSLAVVPIQVMGKYWGFLSKVSDEELVWEEFELHALRAAAAGIGGAIAREENDVALRRQAEELRLHRKAALSLMEDARRASQSAEQASRAKSTFLAMMSHEIRTPLNGVIGFTDLLLAEGLPSAQADYAHAIRACGETLLGLITDILDISKIESGRLELDIRDGDFFECVRSVATAVEVTARQKGLTLTLDWDPRTPVFLSADFNRLRQIIFNLLGNAIKFTERGSVALRVWSQQEDSGARIYCSVKDTGPGISASEIEHIFDPFTQGRLGASAATSGTGLGLTICRKLIEAMQGEIRVSSELGHGSEFQFFFPARLARSTVRPAEPEAPPLPKDLSSFRVLLVDDVPTNLMVAARLLQRFGLVAHTARSGEDALALVQDRPFDLIFMDILMPGLNGHETTRRIRALKQLPEGVRPWIVALTADALPENRQLCRDAGMDDFITKPLRYAEIEACLVRWRSAAAS